MKRWLSVSALSLVLCFLIGAWWGHRLQEQKASLLPSRGEVHLLAKEGAFNQSLIEKVENKYQIELRVRNYKNPGDLLRMLKQDHPTDLVHFPSSLFEPLQQQSFFDPLDTTRINNLTHVSSDLRFAVWDPHENFALPLNWNALFFIYHPAQTKITEESLKLMLDKKSKKVSLKKNLENVLWLSQILGYAHNIERFEDTSGWIERLKDLPWEESNDLNDFKTGKLNLLQLSWSQIQTLKSELGDFKVWYPKEPSPFFIDYIAIRQGRYEQDDIDLVYETLNAIYDPEIYKTLISNQEALGVMEFPAKTDLQSARLFRQLPLSQIRPLISTGFEWTDLQQAGQEILQWSDEQTN